MQCLRLTLYDSADRASDLEEQAIDLNDACYPLLMGIHSLSLSLSLLDMHACIYTCITHTHMLACSHMHIINKFSSVQLYVKLQQCDFRTNFKLTVDLNPFEGTLAARNQLSGVSHRDSFCLSTELTYTFTRFFPTDCGKGPAPHPHSLQTLLQPSKQLWRAGCGPPSKPK